MGIKKSIKKLMRMPTEMRFSEAKMVLEYFGFKLLRSKGSHFTFQGASRPLTIACHSGKIKHGYIEKIKDMIEENLKISHE